MRVDGLVADASALIRTKPQLLNLPKIPGINMTRGEDVLAHLYVLVKSTQYLWKLFHSRTSHLRARLRSHAAGGFAPVMFSGRGRYSRWEGQTRSHAVQMPAASCGSGADTG